MPDPLRVSVCVIVRAALAEPDWEGVCVTLEVTDPEAVPDGLGVGEFEGVRLCDADAEPVRDDVRVSEAVCEGDPDDTCDAVRDGVCDTLDVSELDEVPVVDALKDCDGDRESEGVGVAEGVCVPLGVWVVDDVSD